MPPDAPAASGHRSTSTHLQLDGAGPARSQLSRSRWVDRDWIRDHMPELVGRPLACTCPLGAPCHRDVLLARAELLARHQLAAQSGQGEPR